MLSLHDFWKLKRKNAVNLLPPKCEENPWKIHLINSLPHITHVGCVSHDRLKTQRSAASDCAACTKHKTMKVLHYCSARGADVNSPRPTVSMGLFTTQARPQSSCQWVVDEDTTVLYCVIAYNRSPAVCGWERFTFSSCESVENSDTRNTICRRFKVKYHKGKSTH